jgi:hypothetical protein
METVKRARTGFETSPRWMLAAAVAMVACAPGTDDAAAPVVTMAGFVPDTDITEAEQAAGTHADGAEEPGNDFTAPTAETDGDVTGLAPSFDGEGSTTNVDGTGTAVDAATGCRAAAGYSHGNRTNICVVTVDGKLVEVRTAQAFGAMRAAAASAGVHISIVSGFRTMDQQRYLYNLYLSGRGNLAARPGYSNHQSGLALDLNTSSSGVYNWLSRNASRYGFRRTVPSEAWHWERPAGSQGSFSGGATSGRCFSTTLGREVAEKTCVEARLDSAWYQCDNGTWYAGRGSRGACSSTHPLSGGSTTPPPSSSGGRCYSGTLGRDMPVGACLQSRFDRDWYQCASIGWVMNNNIRSSRRGYAGACSSYTPL